MKFLEYDQQVADLERMLQEKEQELKDKDFQMNNLGYKQRYEDSQKELNENQRKLYDTEQQLREAQMLLGKHEEKDKQVHHRLLQSQSFFNQALKAAHKIQSLLTLGQHQSNRALNLLNDPIEEFNATTESPSFAVHDGQRSNKRALSTPEAYTHFTFSCLPRMAGANPNRILPLHHSVRFFLLSNRARRKTNLWGLYCRPFAPHLRAFTLYSSRDDYRAAINMENNDSLGVTSDEYNLSRNYFSREISTGNSQWRSSQVDSALSSFEEAKKVISAQAIHEIHKYLKSGRWIHDALTASRHPAYKTMKGHSGGNSKGVPLFYYPYFFVLQAIFPPSDPLSIVCEDIGRHWGLRVSVYEPFYPRLQDSEKEMVLTMGKSPRPQRQVEHPSQSQYSPALFTPTQDGNPEMEDQKDSIQVATDTARTSLPVPTSASDTLRNYDQELASVRASIQSDIEQRFAKFRAQIQQDAAEP
ncbi:hypothetical protein FACUT_6501 [Fusarium acutatum]|uniref:Uncharacterized protein n=1 Tax=Fusarium acutatum TaxID=78861 RepID=A0A8H4NRV9_9HYPO|nr:hypothetical protein FACUT_6501 [Fusarium acutatum]